MTNQVNTASSANRGATPAVLDSVRAHTLQRLGELAKGVFDKLETVVWEWAKELPPNEQQPYMDVILIGRKRRMDIEPPFIANMATAFMTLLQTKKTSKREEGEAPSYNLDGLSLVNTEDMDISVAVDAMVSKARVDFALSLSQLEQRFAAVLPQVQVSQRNMPLDPGIIANNFKNVLLPLDFGVQEKILIIKVFQMQFMNLMTGLKPLLDEVNQLFINAGVLPELKGGVPPSAAANKKSKGDKSAKKQENTTPEEVFALLKDIVGQGALGGGGAGSGAPVEGATYHGGQYVGGGGIGALPASVVGGSVAAVPLVPQQIAPTAVVQTVATPELLTLLSQIQQNQPKAALVEDDSAPSVEEVRSNIRDSLKSDAKTVETVMQADEDVINLVSMLFDFILDDDDLPTAMKALIGRLQIPLLKVAIIDKTFFNAESHSARRLLNLLAKAGIGWSSKDPKGDALYKKIEDVVFRILNEFIDDLDMFDDLLEEFTEFYEQQQKREEAVDKRTRETEEGKAKADLARAMVQQTLNRRVTGRQLPPVVVRLLQEAWRNVLYLHCLKEGTDSDEWKQAVKVVDVLIWSVSPQPGAEWQARLKDIAPKLINSLKKSLSAVHFDPLTTETLLRELSQVHLELLHGQETRTVAILDAKTASAKPDIDKIAATDMVSADTSQAQAIVMPEAEPEADVVSTLPEDNENVVKVNRLNVGSWVEFTEEEKQDRHKLVARIRSIDKLIFANRRGIKVGEMSGMRLAVDLHAGKARVVEEGEFIDRALESVIGSLREKGSKAAP